MFGVTRKAKKSANLPEGRTRGLGQLHPLGLAQLGEATLSRGATPLPAPRTARGGGRPSDQRSGLPRKLQTEALGAGSRGGRRGAQHAGGEAAKLFKDPDYFPLNEKQQQQQQLLPLPRAPASGLSLGGPALQAIVAWDSKHSSVASTFSAHKSSRRAGKFEYLISPFE